MFQERFFYFVNLHVMSTGLLIRIYWNAFIIFQFCVFVHDKLFAAAFKIFRECYSPKYDVSFQKSVCKHAENCPMRISL